MPCYMPERGKLENCHHTIVPLPSLQPRQRSAIYDRSKHVTKYSTDYCNFRMVEYITLHSALYEADVNQTDEGGGDVADDDPDEFFRAFA